MTKKEQVRMAANHIQMDIVPYQFNNPALKCRESNTALSYLEPVLEDTI